MLAAVLRRVSGLPLLWPMRAPASRCCFAMKQSRPMAENRQRQPLLGRLAALGWFAQNGEVAATQAVAMLLEEPPLRDALIRRLAQITETELASVALHFQAELVHDDLARPDLEGRDSRSTIVSRLPASATRAIVRGRWSPVTSRRPCA